MIVQSSVVFDFEYSGYDDLSKFALDWVLQLTSPLIVSLNLYLSNYFVSNSHVLDLVGSNDIAIQKLAFYRWILIQLKSLPLRSDQRSFDKLVSYINCCNAIHGFALDVSSQVSIN